MIPILMTVHVVMDKQPNAGLIEASGGDPIGGGDITSGPAPNRCAKTI
jgi:hypothetical protein